MIALYINDKPAIIKSGTSIKLTRENPFFTSAGDYTHGLCALATKTRKDDRMCTHIICPPLL